MTTDATSSTKDNISSVKIDFVTLWNDIRREVNTQQNENDPKKGHNNIIQSTPTMVFSIIGDSDSFVPRPWPTTLFQTALIEAAKSGGETWILFRKNNKGVSNVVKSAYLHYEAMEFGRKRKKMHDPDRHIKLINIAGKQNKQETNHDWMNRYKEEPEIYDTSIQVPIQDSSQLEFEKIISKQEVSFFSQKMDIKMPVPIAIIVCEGDFNTIEQILEALKNKLPVIIMKGSGKAADLVLDFIQDNADELWKKASILFGIQFDDKKYKELQKLLEKIKEKRNLIGKFDLDKDDPLMLSNIIGEAVVSCWSTEHIISNDTNNDPAKNQTKTDKDTTSKEDKSNSQENGHTLKGYSLAWKLMWNNSVSPNEETINQIVQGLQKESRPYVLNPMYSAPTSLPLYFYFVYQLLQESNRLEIDGPILLLEALKANRCDYVRVLLAKGVQFNIDYLPELYGQTVSCKDCKFEKDCLHMQWILKQIQEKQAKKLFSDYKVMTKERCKEGEEWDKNHKKEINELPFAVAEAAKELCCSILRYEKSKDNEKVKSKEEKTSTISDVLLWAIFANRKELSEICWLRGEDHLLTGLVCSAILRKLSKKASNVKEQIFSNDLEEHSKLFEQRCIGLMDNMFNENTKYAIDSMDDEAVVWGIRSSPLTFAYENFMYDVVAHTCSQKNMNKQWYNKLAPDLKPFLKSAFREPKKFFTAPLTKYLFNYMMFFTMLVMYSAFVLTSVSTKYYVQDIARVFEYYVYFWGAGDFIEELISCFGCLEKRGRSHRNYYSRMKRYLYDFWNVVDLLSYILLIAALFMRHFYIDESFTIARRMFALSLLVMYLRFLEVFLIHRKLGPTLIMIKEMLKDLLRFLFIAVFVVLGVGIYYHANLWPDHQTIWKGDWTNWRIWTIIYYPYWQLYAELNLETLEASEELTCSNDTSVWEADTSINRCPQEDWTVQAVAAIYLLFSNLLLVNLVIAMFSYTFERVQENSEKLWRFERYTVINDYDWRIPSPINLLFLPYRFIYCPIRVFYKKKKNIKKEEKDKKNETPNQQMQEGRPDQNDSDTSNQQIQEERQDQNNSEISNQEMQGIEDQNNRDNGNKKPDDKKNKMNKMEKKKEKQAFRRTFQKIVALRNHSKI